MSELADWLVESRKNKKLTQAELVEKLGVSQAQVRMPRLVTQLTAQFAESARLEKLIRKNLNGLGYGE